MSVHKSKKEFSHYKKIIISSNQIKGYNENLGVGGNSEKMKTYNAVIQKMHHASTLLVSQKFHIRNMKIFKLVDTYFDKFSGFSLNLDLAVMLNSGEHTED